MAFIDALNRVSVAQALTVTAVSTSSVDLGGAGRDVATGEPIELTFRVNVAGDRTTADETYEVQAVQSANADLTSHDVLASRPLQVAELVVGTTIRLPIPPGSVTKQYLGARYVLAGTTPTITITADLGPSSMRSTAPKSYPKGYTGPA